MPTYEYECPDGHQYEMREGFDAPATQRCIMCRKTARRVLSAPAIVFKGSGFYVTDSRKSESTGESASTADSKAGADSKSDGASESTSETKSETKSGAKTETKAATDHGHSHGPGGHSHDSTPKKTELKVDKAAASS